jgi:peptidoglycan/LPS O-acetylase OafA/YrhL
MEQTKSLYYYLSKHRSSLMGIAILWVIWFHSHFEADFFSINAINKGLSFIKGIGYGGVDIFLILSGMGIYNSLEKNDLSKFIKNRFKRIIPTWWIYLVVCILLGLFVTGKRLTVSEIIGFAGFTGYWIDMSNQGNWYVYAIILFYLVSPILHSIIKDSKNKYYSFIVLMMISSVIIITYFNNTKLIAFSRLPIYIIGMYISRCFKERRLKNTDYLMILTLFFAGLALLVVFIKFFYDKLWTYGLYWYPFIIIAPTLSLILAKLFDISEKYIKPLLKALSMLGKSSLEILLISDCLLPNYKSLDAIIPSEKLANFTVLLMSVIIGILFHYSIDALRKKISNTNKRN